MCILFLLGGLYLIAGKSNENFGILMVAFSPLVAGLDFVWIALLVVNKH